MIVAAKRTPFGRYGGKFVKTSAAELQIVAAKAALAAGNVKPELIDSVIVGNVRLVSSEAPPSLRFYAPPFFISNISIGCTTTCSFLAIIS